ncbi:MAG TPA: hypothetical protein VMS99_02500 [Acidimicrobiia bacterium]|nr:hypothetical protein [Acidimicrobiia bacterium]
MAARIWSSGYRQGSGFVTQRPASWSGWPVGSRLPVLRERFAAGDLSLDQVDAISKMATADTEEGLIEECLGLSIAALDRAARRANPPTIQDEREMWQRRCLFIHHSLDGWKES